LDEYGLENNFFAHIKDEGSNMNVMTITLNFTVSYESFDLEENFQDTYFGHVF
jgi:hypothetical protein